MTTETHPELDGLGRYDYGWSDADDKGANARRGQLLSSSLAHLPVSFSWQQILVSWRRLHRFCYPTTKECGTQGEFHTSKCSCCSIANVFCCRSSRYESV